MKLFELGICILITLLFSHCNKNTGFVYTKHNINRNLRLLASRLRTLRRWCVVLPDDDKKRPNTKHRVPFTEFVWQKCNDSPSLHTHRTLRVHRGWSYTDWRNVSHDTCSVRRRSLHRRARGRCPSRDHFQLAFSVDRAAVQTETIALCWWPPTAWAPSLAHVSSRGRKEPLTRK